jgi:hypothetical protein
MRNYKNHHERKISNDHHHDVKGRSIVEENSSPSTINVYRFSQSKPSLSGRGPAYGSSLFDNFESLEFFPSPSNRTRKQSVHESPGAATVASSSTTKTRRRHQEFHEGAVSSSSSYRNQASIPIPCPIPKQDSSVVDECEVDEGLAEIYNQATWNMYHR